jgi:Dolichyl-phosphate-mannose-protein mannosyltransferase
MIDGSRPALGGWRPHAIAGALLATMAVLMFTSIHDDVITVDEQPHIGAGYSYLVRADFRMNREHPPLMKDLAAVPLLFMNLRVPWDDTAWQRGDEWGFGGVVMYRSGRSPDKVTRAAKIPMMLFTLGLGWMIYWWTSRTFGPGAGLLALFLFAFSPTFLAHGRLVHTDVGAAAGIFLGTVCTVELLQRPTVRSLLLCGIVLGGALLAKFSTVLLLPAVIILTILWVMTEPPGAGSRPLLVLQRLALAGGVFVAGALAIHVVYLHHTWNFPERAADVVQSDHLTTAAETLEAWMLDTRVLRPWGYYLAGLRDAVARARDPTRPFFRGTVLTSSSVEYFPALYLVKEPLALHALTLVALLWAPWWPRFPFFRGGWLRRHFAACALVIVWVLYWTVAMSLPLQIGVRHVLPTFPFVYVLVASGIVTVATTLRTRRAVCAFWTAVALLLTWQAITVLRIHPSYIAYFNEVAGGPDGGAEWATDSNLDWGQDLKRLVKFMDAHGIREVQLDYFGSAPAEVYLLGRYRPIGECSEPQPGWVAVSSLRYVGSRERVECDYRRWLTKERLVARVGYSIFVFRVD